MLVMLCELTACRNNNNNNNNNNNKINIDKSVDSPLCRLCGEKGETINHGGVGEW